MTLAATVASPWLSNGADRMLVAVDDRGRVIEQTHGVGNAQ